MSVTQQSSLSDLSTTCFENLANEIYYEIFEYLDGCDIYKAFSNLNTRFQRLITSSSLLLKISLDSKSELNTEYLYRYVIIPNKHRIISFHLWNIRLIDEFFDYALYSSFNRLESIGFHSLLPSKIISYLSYLHSLPRLFSLTIEVDRDANDRVDFDVIYQTILHLPSLKYSSFLFSRYHEFDTSAPSAMNERFSNIEFLIINHDFSTKRLISILRHTPRIRHLTCRCLVELSRDSENEVSVTVPHLTHITIRDCMMTFADFEKFIKKICSQLKVLHIMRFVVTYCSVPNQWEHLISQHMSHLIDFHVRCSMITDDSFQDLHFNSSIHQLTLQFWLERGWNITFQNQCTPIVFTIHSNRTVNISSNENDRYNLGFLTCSFSRHTTNNSSTHVSVSAELSITGCWIFRRDRLFSGMLDSVFIKTEIRSLYLDGIKMSIYMFVELLRMLPNLASLKMSSSFNLQTTKFSNEDVQKLRLLSNSNTISKVSTWMKFKQVKLFINLCPAMEHLEVSEVKERDLEKFIHFIFKKTITNIHHLQSFRLNIHSAKEETIHKLHKIINSEKRLSNYMIKYVDSSIFLQSKLERFIQFDVNLFRSIKMLKQE